MTCLFVAMDSSNRSQSYHDLAVRLEPIILELEREHNDLLIIAHESVLRVLYGYLMACSATDIPKLHFPRDEIIEVRPIDMCTRCACEQVTKSNHLRLFQPRTATRQSAYMCQTCLPGLCPIVPKTSKCLPLHPAQ